MRTEATNSKRTILRVHSRKLCASMGETLPQARWYFTQNGYYMFVIPASAKHWQG